MMSVPAINSVMPPSGSQSAKIRSSPTANPSVSSIGLSVQPKLSVIPPPQIPTSPNKPPIGVNHSSVPLSLVYDNKVVGSQTQSSLSKPTSDKPKDLSPTKPTPNGVEASAAKTSLQTQQTQPSSTGQFNKPEDASVPLTTTNHSDERIPTNESAPAKNDDSVMLQNTTREKIEQSTKENAKDGESNADIKNDEQELKQTSEGSTAETVVEKTDAKTTPANKRKRDQKPQEKKDDEPEPEKKTRRIRSQVLPYQSPLPELTTFINKSLKEKDGSQKNSEEKLIVFYKNEFLAVRNAEGGFYLCQTLQNVYRSSHRIRIRWLSQNKESSNDDGDIYAPDFYDLTDFECILTTVALNRMDKNMYKLPKVELERIENILKRALDVEKGITEKPSITEEHPDGIDLSLYKDESQLQKPKKSAKRKTGSPTRKSPKRQKKDQSNDTPSKTQTARKAKGKSRSKSAKRPIKTTSNKGRSGKRGGGRSDSSKSKAVDQLKVSPPNEKARVVAKVLRKIDIVPVKEVSTKKPAKGKGAKSKDTSKNQKKNPTRNAKKGNQDGAKEEEAQSHHERRNTKVKYNNNRNKKN